jgi:hypothetical protein
MKKNILGISKSIGLPGAIIIGLCAGASLLVISCATTGQPVTVGGETGKSGAQLWAENCVRCHNIRSPSSLSPVQWEVAAMHMRIRANLTPEEHKKILEFLKSGT